jgi:hypothetical protein
LRIDVGPEGAAIRTEQPMRIILVTLIVAAFVLPAQAQRMKGKRGGDPNQAHSADAKKKKASQEEKAAKSALEKLPDKPYDPWKTMR